MLIVMPSAIDSHMPGTDSKCRVSLIAVQSRSANSTALPSSREITIGTRLVITPSINSSSLAAALSTLSSLTMNPSTFPTFPTQTAYCPTAYSVSTNCTPPTPSSTVAQRLARTIFTHQTTPHSGAPVGEANLRSLRRPALTEPITPFFALSPPYPKSSGRRSDPTPRPSPERPCAYYRH